MNDSTFGSCIFFCDNWLDAEEVGCLDDSAFGSCTFLCEVSLEPDEMFLSDAPALTSCTFFCDALLLLLDEVAVVDVLGRDVTRFAGRVLVSSRLGLLGGSPEIRRLSGGCLTGR